MTADREAEEIVRDESLRWMSEQIDQVVAGLLVADDAIRAMLIYDLLDDVAETRDAVMLIVDRLVRLAKS